MSDSNERFEDLDVEIEVYFKMQYARCVALDFEAEIAYLADHKQKQYVTIKKMTPVQKHMNGADLLVIINPEHHYNLDEEAKQILCEQAIGTISYSLDSGKITITKPDVNTFSGILKKYGVDKVSRANNLVALINEQKEDKSAQEGHVI